MTLEDFKDVYKDAPLLTKLNLLMEVQSRRADAQAIAATERWNENAEAERHWVNEHRSASAKAMWLFEELKKALKAQEPCEDWISRKRLKDEIQYYIDEAGWGEEVNKALGWCLEFIDNQRAVTWNDA